MESQSTNSNFNTANIDLAVVSSLRNYRGVSTLRKEAISVLIKMLNPIEIKNLSNEFVKIDKDQTGMINMIEL